MTLQEFYAEVGGSYDDIIARMRSDRLVYKFLFKFPAAEDYSGMLRCIEEENWPEAFRYVHNLKGVGLNLSLDDLAGAASTFCEEIRNGPPTHDIAPMLEAIKEKYDFAIAKIAELKESSGL